MEVFVLTTRELIVNCTLVHTITSTNEETSQKVNETWLMNVFHGLMVGKNIRPKQTNMVNKSKLQQYNLEIATGNYKCLLKLSDSFKTNQNTLC